MTGIRIRLIAALLLALPTSFAHAFSSAYFNLSTYKSFAPGEQPKLHLYARNVDELEFRVYHVNDPERFIAGLPELHSFGASTPTSVERIDEETWLERFHDWKHGLWLSIRRFLRTQLSHDTREALQVRQSKLVKRSRIIGVAQFAQIPLLNDKQLVARWRQEMPPTFVSDNQILPIQALPVGLYLVEATDGHLKAYTILLVSETALVTRTVAGRVLAFTVDRKTGAPVADAAVSLDVSGSPAMHQTTGADGVAEFAAPAKTAEPKGEEQPAPAEESKLWVIAQHGNDIALVAPFSGSFTSASNRDFVSYVYTDRPVYRPGHTVHWKAVIRECVGDAPTLPRFSRVHAVINDDQQKAVFDKELEVSANGTVHGDVMLAEGSSLGDYSIQISGAKGEPAEGLSGIGSFRVEEYRKPEYSVRVSAAKQHVLQGSGNTVTIDARYFFGEPVVKAKVKYTVHQSPHFWYEQEGDEAGGDGAAETADAGDEGGQEAEDTSGDQELEQTGTLNAEGKLVVNIPTRFNAKQHTDKDYVIEGGVTDEAGREVSGRYRFLATYGSFRIGVEPMTYFAAKGKPIAFNLMAIDYEGKPIAVPVHVRLERTKRNGGDVTVEDAGSADARTGSDGRTTVQLAPSLAGSIQVVASASTREGRTLEERSWVYVGGSGDEEAYGEGNHIARIVADKKIYAPGDTAHLSVVGDVAGFSAMVTATGYTVEFRKTLTTSGRSLDFDLPITKDSQPNLTIDAVFIKDEQLYQASKSLKVPPTQQALEIVVAPAAATFQPQQAATYDVMTRDVAGHPVSADLSFGVVDEAIYSLYKDTSGDLLRALYPNREIYASVESSLTYYFSGEAGEKSPMLAERQRRYRPQLAQVKATNDVVQPRVRKDFPDTAFWQPDIHTDGSGHARVTLTFPDSLTTWRATVRAVTADSKAGSFVNRVIVRKNLIVRMGQPRFLRKNDVVTIPVIVHNYLSTMKSVRLSLEAPGLETLVGAPKQVEVAPKGEATVSFKLRATAIGTAHLRASAVTTEESDAIEITLPVEPSGVARTLSTSGSIAGEGQRELAMNFPVGTDAAAHTIKVEVSPSIAGSIFGALDYLTSFPYGCTEQTMSSFLPNILVADAAKKLHLEDRLDARALKEKIQAGYDRLADYQHDDGGWGWWKEDASQVFMTAYVVSGYGQARRAGFDRPGGNLKGGVGYLEQMLRKHSRMLPELRAYVVYALAEAGPQGVDGALLKDELDTLYKRRADLSAQGLAYTGLAMERVTDGRAHELPTLLEKRAVTEGELTSWPLMRDALLDIDADATPESTALALKFLSHEDPQSALLPRAAQWLVADRNQGSYWSSTQQTSSVLLGLTDYLMVSHELSGESDVEVLLNGVSVGHRHFSQADVIAGATLPVNVDASRLQPQNNAVRIVTHGARHAYFSAIGMYFSTDRSAFQQGTMSLNVARDYFKLMPEQKDGNIVYRLEPLRSPVQQGDVLAAHLTVSGTPAKYLLIEDPIPAGVEFVQHEEGYNISERPSTWSWWYTRREFHDDRVAIFATSFNKLSESFYLLKVVNPGSFAISPASVQPMYQPGVRATTDELHLDVLDVPAAKEAH